MYAKVGGNVTDVMIDLGRMPPNCYPATFVFYRTYLATKCYLGALSLQ